VSDSSTMAVIHSAGREGAMAKGAKRRLITLHFASRDVVPIQLEWVDDACYSKERL